MDILLKDLLKVCRESYIQVIKEEDVITCVGNKRDGWCVLVGIGEEDIDVYEKYGEDIVDNICVNEDESLEIYLK